MENLKVKQCNWAGALPLDPDKAIQGNVFHLKERENKSAVTC